MDTYVRSEHELIWHWNSDCSAYPRFLAAIRTVRPEDEFLCGECREIDEQKQGDTSLD